jgi:hypothetical protein
MAVFFRKMAFGLTRREGTLELINNLAPQNFPLELFAAYVRQYHQSRPGTTPKPA